MTRMNADKKGMAPVLRSSPATPVLRSSAEGGEGGSVLASPIYLPLLVAFVPFCEIGPIWPQFLGLRHGQKSPSCYKALWPCPHRLRCYERCLLF